jgi:RNA polymerase sigma-70 factor (sigma-E family)
MRNFDETEFTKFAASANQRLHRTAYLICGDWHRAEDAAQDALVTICRRWKHIERDESLNSYAHRVLVNAVHQQSRRPWRREQLDDANGLPDSESPDPITSVDDRQLIRGALVRMPPGQRACVVLRYYADLSIEQTADALGISPGTVKSQTFAGLGHLRKAFGQPLGSATPVAPCSIF